ncbi:Acetylxylan esterase precursor [Sedimentisphaera cyanobacteriorum]|uniref:Acetylxylan esterase n=1 Tax=Sedimentisphaera cyanobacteriorum TaxID=1940790 RepID=A0A1Q2HN86_9BACT|nr:alpha/beta hydrolase [Sedimentisphaera cyanobacteriorum]AQQ08999.1 Acetylxylan esterase precursor [Sedimentisphaera cyanobacteriorum]
MNFKAKFTFIIIFCLALAVSAMSDGNQRMNKDAAVEMSLWHKSEIPHFKDIGQEETIDHQGHLSNVDTPEIEIYLPPEDNRNGSAVVICPGGGYSILSIEKEGRKIADWLNSFGTAGIVLKYRHKYFQHPVPLMDAQRAVRLTRLNAGKWGIEADKVGIMGFSAGGHLASTAGTHYSKGSKNAEEPAERFSSRPDFMILVYPVISMQRGITHGGSKISILGRKPDKQLVDELSNELQVTSDTPPAFLIHAADDRAVPYQNSVLFYEALIEAGVLSELHIYPRGGHGFGMMPGSEFGPAQWPEQCRDWLERTIISK